VDRVDLHSCGHRIHHVHPNIDNFSDSSPNTPHWSINTLKQISILDFVEMNWELANLYCFIQSV
jgi:hypothetical protein